MRLLMVIRSLDVGGAERQCRALAVELAGRGHSVMLCTLGTGGTLSAGLSDAKVEHRSLVHRGPRDLLRSCLRLRELVKTLQPEVIYSFMSVSNVVCALSIPRRFRRRLVWGIRSADIDHSAFGYFVELSFFVERKLADWPGLVIVNSEAGKKFHIGLGFKPQALRVVENAIDTATFIYDAQVRNQYRQLHGVSETTCVVVILARIDRIKGYDVFLDAAASVAARRCDVEFWSIGGGQESLRQEFATRAKVLGLESRIKWHGEIRDAKIVAGLLMASDVAVSASVSEGFPNAVAECRSCGLRVVGTDVGDTKRIIGDAGECVSVGDPEAMSAAILRQLDMSVPRDQLRADFLSRFAPRVLLDRHESLLRDVASSESATVDESNRR
jgi:glycosyltransferase involved in cell wall biosynthesis